MLDIKKSHFVLVLSASFFICYGEEEMYCPSLSSVTGSYSFGSELTGTGSLVQKFVSTFSDSVRSSEELRDVFEISDTTPAIFRKFMYKYVFDSATNHGMESPECIANTAAKAVEDHFQTLVPTVMIKVFANTAAKHLEAEGLLNPSNVVSHAIEYANALKEFATHQNVAKDNPEWKLKALMDGIEKFFTSLDLLVANKGQTIASTFANEVKLAGMELRRDHS